MGNIDALLVYCTVDDGLMGMSRIKESSDDAMLWLQLFYNVFHILYTTLTFINQ